MSEKTFVKKLKKRLAKEFGGFWFKVHGGPFQLAGLPDLIGCVRGRFIGIECKAPGKMKTLTELQVKMLSIIRKAGGLGFATDNIDKAVSRVRRWLREPLL